MEQIVNDDNNVDAFLIQHIYNDDSINTTTEDIESTNEIPVVGEVPLNNNESVNTVEPPIFEFPAVYSYINDIYLQLNNKIEQSKEEIINSLEPRLSKLEAKIGAYESSLKSRMLILEDDVEKNKQVLQSINNSMRNCIKNDKMADTENKVLENINEKFVALRNEISNNLTISINQYNDYVEFKTDFERNTVPILDRINEDYVNPQRILQPNQILSDNSNSEDIVTVEEIKCDVLFLGDSNILKMKPEIMDHQINAQKYFCPHTIDIIDIIDRCTVVETPKKIYIQTGTNDIESVNFDAQEYGRIIMKLLELIKIKFDNPIVVISSILPRKHLMDVVNSINNMIDDICDVTPRLKFLNNTNITIDMLKDKKHLDNKGFVILLTNIRFILFNKLPKIRNRENKYSHNRWQYKSQNGYHSVNNRYSNGNNGWN